jgi:hypothetical protein
MHKVAAQLGVGTGTVRRIKAEMTARCFPPSRSCAITFGILANFSAEHLA